METTLGRKITILFNYFICAICMVINEFVGYQNSTVQLIISLIFRFCIAVASTCFYTFTIETYPAPVRALGFGINSTAGELGSMFTSMLVELIPTRVMSLINAALCLGNGLVVLFLKETAGLPMEETIKEIEEENNIKDSVPLLEKINP